MLRVTQETKKETWVPPTFSISGATYAPIQDYLKMAGDDNNFDLFITRWEHNKSPSMWMNEAAGLIFTLV